MRLVWVPQWTVLPVIVEDRAMGEDNVDSSRLPLQGSSEGALHGSGLGNYDDSSAGRKFYISPTAAETHGTSSQHSKTALTSR